jgi:EmrB/QacA subfamily drug resistance transporter
VDDAGVAAIAPSRATSQASGAGGLSQRVMGLDNMWQSVIVVVIGSFMVMLDTTIVNIALPRITAVFGATVDQSQLVLTGYMLALAVVMPASGYLTDTFGAKRVYLFTITLFTLGSAMCGVAWDINSLVVFRVLQGLGGGMLMPLGMTILYKVVPPQQRGTVMGVFGIPLMLAPVLGPTLGGYLVEYVDWRTIFTLNIPVGILGFFLTVAMLRETDIVEGGSFDLPGFLLSAVGFGSLLLGLSRGASDGWAALHIVIYLYVGTSCLLLWIIVELHSANPMVDLSVLRNFTYALSTVISFITSVAMFSSMFLLPLFLQNLRGLGAMESGLLTFPQALGSLVTAPISGKLFDKIGPRPLILSGVLMVSYITWRLSFINLATGDAELRILLVVRGAGMGMMMMPAMTAGMNTVAPPLVARASSLTNVLRQLFGSFGTAAFATILQNRQSFHQSMLSQSLVADSPVVRGAIASMQQYLMQQGASATQVKAVMGSSLSQYVALGASVRAFDDAFLLSALVMIVAVIPGLFLVSTGVDPQRQIQAGLQRQPKGGVPIE